MADDPWKGIEPERVELARGVFAAAKQIADEDGDGDFDLSEMPPALRAVGGGFNRLVSRAAKGELDENDPNDIVDALRVASAALVDQRQPSQYQGYKWMNKGEPLVSPQTPGETIIPKNIGAADVGRFAPPPPEAPTFSSQEGVSSALQNVMSPRMAERVAGPASAVTGMLEPWEQSLHRVIRDPSLKNIGNYAKEGALTFIPAAKGVAVAKQVAKLAPKAVKAIKAYKKGVQKPVGESARRIKEADELIPLSYGQRKEVFKKRVKDMLGLSEEEFNKALREMGQGPLQKR